MHAVARLPGERVREDPSLLVFVNDIAFKMDCAPCGFDRFEPGHIIFSCVFEDARAVARDQPGAGGAPEGLFGENADGGLESVHKSLPRLLLRSNNLRASSSVV